METTPFQNPFFKNTMKDINTMTPLLGGVMTHALELGVSEKGINLANAWSRCDRAIRELLEARQTAKNLGYTSLNVALKALGQIKNRQDDISYLPEIFHTFPLIWVRGKVDSKPGKKEDGFKPMTPSNARRKYKVIQSLIIEAWQLAERREEAEQIHDSMIKQYLSVSAEEFENLLYRYIYDLEEVTLEQEFAQLLPVTPEEIESTYKFMVDPNRIYGVVSKEQFNEEEQQ